MKKIVSLTCASALTFFLYAPVNAGVTPELDAEFDTARYTSDMIIDANRAILKAIPHEQELAKLYSSAQLARMMTQLKKVMSANVDHLEIVVEVMDTMYEELKK